MSTAKATATAKKAAVTETWISVEDEESQNNALSNDDPRVIVEDEATTSGHTEHDQGASERAVGSRHQASVDILGPGFRLNAPLPNDDQIPRPTDSGHSAGGEALMTHISVLSHTVQPTRSDPLAGGVDSVEPTAMMERHVQGVEPDRHRGDNLRCCAQRRWKALLLVSISSSVLLFAAIIVIIVLALNQSNGDGSNGGGRVTNAPTSAPILPSRFDTIRNQGYLACGVVEYPGFSMRDRKTGNWSGFEVDLCRAVGAAIFREDGHVRFTTTNNSGRFILLQSKEVDLLAAGATYTMERDVYEPSTNVGFTFSVPYLYNGVSFAGVPKYVACADQGLTTGNCTGIKICVQDGTSHVPVLKSLFPNLSVINLAPSTPDFYNNFVKGLCNVLAGEQFDLAKSNVIQAGYRGNYSISQNLYSKEPIAMVTRDDDAEWSDFVNWVFLALLTAEKQSITQTTAQATVLNPGPAIDLALLPFYQAVAIVGNYAEMYQRHLESIVRRAPVNQQNNGSTPLIHSFPFGNNATFRPGSVTTSGTLERILKRGYLLCGTAETLFFAKFNRSEQEWEGFDVDYCRAVSSAIFKGIGSTVFVPVTPGTRWEMLQNGTIDLISWDTTWNYERDVLLKRHTQRGFTFAQPNFYTGLQFGGIPFYHDCAKIVNVQEKCSALKICVRYGGTITDEIKNLFADRFISPQDDAQQVNDCLRDETGNVIIGDGFFTAPATVRELGYSGDYKTTDTLFSRENLAVATNQEDPQWSSFVNWVVMATFYAEEQNITKATNSNMPTTNIFGNEFSTMFQDAIAAVGSHGEILARNAKGKYNISVINQLNDHPHGPLHYPPAGLFGLY